MNVYEDLIESEDLAGSHFRELNADINNKTSWTVLAKRGEPGHGVRKTTSTLKIDKRGTKESGENKLINKSITFNLSPFRPVTQSRAMLKYKRVRREKTVDNVLKELRSVK